MNSKNYQLPSADVMRDKIMGCWLGKNIGGTLGGPFEGKTEINNLTWYSKDPGGNPLPNDDLDLQLAWLTMVEYYGYENITSRHFGEMWLNSIIGPWGEYSMCRYNCLTGFFPPLSGSCNTDGLNRSNGAWIRAEIWACLAAGRPDEAIRYAWMDSSCDHITDGIYAEMFIAAMEAAAFCVSDVRELLEIGFSKIPADCRLYESIKLVIDGYDAGKSWQSVRDEVVELNKDIGWFQAPGNVAFVVIGLLYGEGDFGKSVCLATNCGDDTDCTAATVGALLGIVLGANAIPAIWKDPIGDEIVMISLNRFSLPVPLPKTITELTERVIKLRNIAACYDPESQKAEADFKSVTYAESLWNRSSYELRFNHIFGEIGVEYPDKPYFTPGEPCRIKVSITDCLAHSTVVQFRWILPENYQCSNGSFYIGNRNYCKVAIESEITVPEDVSDAMVYLQLEVKPDNHLFPTIITVPLRREGSCSFPRLKPDWHNNGIRKLDAVKHRLQEIKG